MKPITFSIAFLIAHAAIASSPSAAYDVVVTTDGILLQGHVAELRPGESVTLVLLSGETRLINWSEIQSTRGPSFPVPPPPPDPALQPGPGRVPVVVHSTGEQLPVGRGATWPQICATPCTLWLPPGPFPLHVGGGVARETAATIDVPSDGLMLTVRPGSQARFHTGTMLLWPAIGNIVLGSIFAGIGSVADGGPRNTFAITGYVGIGVGAMLLTTAATLIGTSRGGIVKRCSGVRVAIAPTGISGTF
jgi:hypothetical protein